MLKLYYIQSIKPNNMAISNKQTIKAKQYQTHRIFFLNLFLIYDLNYH